MARRKSRRVARRSGANKAKPMKNTMTYAVIGIVILLVAGLAIYMYNGTSPYTSNPYPAPTEQGTPAPAPTAPPAVTYTISTSSSQTLGSYLVGSNGLTLYYFTKDTVGSKMSTPVSNCNGGCLNIWPYFYSQSVTVPSGLSAGDFTTFTRSDGYQQTAYKGMPLYYYKSDVNPGDTNGQGVGGVWFVAAP